MIRRLAILMVLLAVIFTAIPVSAAEVPATEEPVIYKDTITVTEDGGRYQVGFVNIEFKKEFLDIEKLPVTLDVEVSMVDGKVGIEVVPSEENFYKQVHVRVDAYKGLIYNRDTNENIFVNVKKQQQLLQHFSRHAFS